MASGASQLFSDPTTYQTLLTAVATAAYASYRANEPLFKAPHSSPSRSSSLSSTLLDDNSRVLEGPLVLAFPLIATLSILILFFFLASIGVVLTALSAVSGFLSLLFLFWPFSELFARRLRVFSCLVSTPSAVLEACIATPIATVVICIWLFSGHWVANNLIGIALCTLFASLCKVPSLKVTVILFAGLFMYDIFFVFFSERVFGRNVMVEVATSTPTNPASALAKLFHLPFSPVQNLALPAKLVFPAGDSHHTILGLGDIILPEILLTHLLEFDLRNRVVTPLRTGYFLRALLAYAVGLVASFYFSYAFQTAQPALLYIVPLVVFPTIILAERRGELVRLWKGAWRTEDEEENRRGEERRTATKEDEQESLLA